MKPLVLVIILIGTVFLTGCPKTQPNMPAVLAKRVAEYEITRFNTDMDQYYCAFDGCPGQARDVAKATRLRDRVIARLKAAVDANYQEFENQLFTGRARANVLLDITELGAGVATTITNGERVKTIISALITGFRGGRKSFDENFFRERTIQVIISQMEASRARVETGMLSNMNDKDADKYSLDTALGDLINYFYAGTLQKGLQELAKETGKSAINAEAAKEYEKGRLGVTREERIQVLKIEDRIEQLFKDANDPDSPDRAEAIATVRKAIEELTGKAPPAEASTPDLFQSLKAAMREANKKPGGGTGAIRKALGLAN